MRELRNSHALICLVTGDARLSARAIAVLLNDVSECLVSAASIWEISIKIDPGKLRLGADPITCLAARMREYRIALLSIRPQHCARLLSLPLHHRDPFGRILIAQAMLSTDGNLDQYGVHRHL